MSERQIQIIVPARASEKEIFAAQELAEFLRLASGINAGLIREDEPGAIGAEGFFVGATRRAEELIGLKALLNRGGEDGYKIVCDGKNCIVCGGAGQGTIFGVYGVLEHMFSLKIYTDDVCTYENKSPDFSAFEKENIPDFPMRAIGIYPVHLERRSPGIGNKRYCYRMRLRQMDEGWGINNHSYFRVLPPAVYKEAHPDWYDESGTMLCLTNEEMTAQYVENMKKIIEDTPEDSLYMFGMEDTTVHCHCSKCRALAEKYGGQDVAVMLVFTNKLVKALNEWLKDKHPERKVWFFTFAYLWAEVPPVTKDENGNYKLLYEDLRPADNLGVLLAPLRSNASYPMNDPRNIETLNTCYHSGPRMPVKEIFEGWRAVVNRICVWSYNQNFYDYIAPCPMWTGLDENYRWFKQLNAYHVFMEAGCVGTFGNFSEMKIYCVSRLMWDCSLKLEDLVKEFMGVYYKGAEKEVYEYFEYIHKHAEWMDKNLDRQMIFVHFDDDPNGRILDARFWPIEMLEKAIDIFDRALEKDLSFNVKKRVLLESVPVKFTLLFLHRDKLPSARVKKMIAELTDIAEMCGVTYIWDDKPNTIQEVLKTWESELSAVKAD